MSNSVFAGGQALVSVSVSLNTRPRLNTLDQDIDYLRPRLKPLQIGLDDTEARPRDLTSLLTA